MRVKYKDDYIVDYGGNSVTISIRREKDPSWYIITRDPAMNCDAGWYIFVRPIGDRSEAYRVGEATNIVKDMAMKKINEAFLTGCLDISDCMEVIL